jgi:cytochrome c-type biogenesis protein CcmH
MTRKDGYRGIYLALLFAALVLVILAGGTLARAQDGGDTGQGPAAGPVSADDVNDVARRLYCPVCENIPLDTCPTAACEEWRQEIRVQLTEGRTAQEIVDDFVGRFGDRVVGTPQDPSLRALSLVTPWAISALALAGAGFVFFRWWGETRRQRANPAAPGPAPDAPQATLDEYRARLEADLVRRR